MYAQIITYHRVFESVNYLTYAIPELLRKQAVIGCLVEIPFGSSVTRGVVVGFLDTTDIDQVKDILRVVDPHIQISSRSIEVIKHVAGYYRLPLYRVLQLFLPKEILLGQYTPSQDLYIVQGALWHKRNELVSSRAKKQLQILTSLEQQTFPILIDNLKPLGIQRGDLRELVQKTIFSFHSQTAYKDPTQSYQQHGNTDFDLNDEQQDAVQTIYDNPKKMHLLFGVTGSGKTEVYIRCIEKLFQESPHAQAMILVPEINLTPQLIARLRDYFGSLSLWHSRLSPQEKLDQWMRIQNGEAKIIIGSRSALFTLPPELKIIIMDEEHDASYKQDTNPRYDTHSVVEIIKNIFHTRVVFGSATPRIETYARAHDDICISKLHERYTQLQLPTVEVVDMRRERLESHSMLSYPLQIAIHQALEQKQQILLFLNRRGFSPSLTCRDCGWYHQCEACDITTTFHVYKDQSYLQCHCCGKYYRMPLRCPECSGVKLFPLGAGTQRVEEELMVRFPHSKILRIDQDTTKGKFGYKHMYEKMISGEADIILGTQMIAKGLDLKNVALVGIILADYGLHIPDFRADEYTFQLLSQVAGRAGRHIAGKVIIQTFSPHHPVIETVKQHDYIQLYNQVSIDRKEFFYPPFSSLIKFEYVHQSREMCKQKSQSLYNTLQDYCQQYDNYQLVGPTPALIARRKNMFHYSILLKHNFSEDILQNIFDRIPHDWIIDRNPYFVV